MVLPPLPLLCPRWPGGAAVERGVRSGHQGRSVTCHVSHSLLIRDGGTGRENWEETSDPCTVNQGPGFYQPILLGRAEHRRSEPECNSYIFHWCWTSSTSSTARQNWYLRVKARSGVENELQKLYRLVTGDNWCREMSRTRIRIRNHSADVEGDHFPVFWWMKVSDHLGEEGKFRQTLFRENTATNAQG